VSGERRKVRATLDFFHDLDRQLPTERGPNGEPSTSDFQTFELLEIVEKFAVGQATTDGSIELVSLGLDTDPDWT